MSAYNNTFLEQLTKKLIDLSSDTIKARAVRTSAYTISDGAVVSGLPAALVTDVTLGSKVLSLGTFDAADAVFVSVPSGAAVDSVVLFKDTATPASDPVICQITGFSVTPNGGDITIQWQNSSPWIFKI